MKRQWFWGWLFLSESIWIWVPLFLETPISLNELPPHVLSIIFRHVLAAFYAPACKGRLHRPKPQSGVMGGKNEKIKSFGIKNTFMWLSALWTGCDELPMICQPHTGNPKLFAFAFCLHFFCIPVLHVFCILFGCFFPESLSKWIKNWTASLWQPPTTWHFPRENLVETPNQIMHEFMVELIWTHAQKVTKKN